MKTWLFAIVLSAAAVPALGREQAKPEPLDAWAVVKPGIGLRMIGPVMSVSKGQGWIATRGEFLDFMLRLKFRTVTPDAEGAILLRAWQRAGSDRVTTGYRIGIRGPQGKPPKALVTGFSEKTQPIAGQSDVSLPPASPGEWHELQVLSQLDRITVRLDGREIGAVDGMEPQAGTIGIEGIKGEIEYSEIWVTRAEVERWDPTAGGALVPLLRATDSRIVRPEVVREVPPRYTTRAVREKVQGVVSVEVVIGTEGHVTQARLLKSLHPELDLEALAAARRWTFKPAFLDGKPVPVIATIDLGFNLK